MRTIQGNEMGIRGPIADRGEETSAFGNSRIALSAYVAPEETGIYLPSQVPSASVSPMDTFRAVSFARR